jgi:hypothetical protein
LIIDIADYCQHPDCKRRTAVWCDGIAACAKHEPWLHKTINKRLREEEEKRCDSNLH